MTSDQQFFTQLLQLAQTEQHRFGVLLKGDIAWQQQVCQIAAQLSNGICFQLGGEPLDFVSQWRAINKGQQLLGHECGLLIVDLNDGFDGNSVNAILGTLRGGGIVVFLQAQQPADDVAAQWLARALDQLLLVEQGRAAPSLPKLVASEVDFAPFSAQQQAIELIKKVVTGGRRRPLVLTADRGRGKTSALGIAAAELILRRPMKIIVTSPSVGNVSPLFAHAEQRLAGSLRSKFTLDWQTSSIQFVAPDELLRTDLECDLLFVDEASAIPLPMLQQMVDRYHRTVFSTTIHGYEGCGRGFSLKFQSWLADIRSGTRFFHMDTPIRWREHDPLEKWQYETFLLDVELEQSRFELNTEIALKEVSKIELLNSANLLRQCFALLINAHYQTTPNDLLLLLGDPTMKLYAAFVDSKCVACIVGVEEGAMDATLAEQVKLGKRRPKGQLVASSLVSQLAMLEPALDRSLRIMRIAVHPDWQGQGIGSQILQQLTALTRYQYLSTSFGVTAQLYRFWQQNGYSAMRLGSQRDQASGCYSVIMVKGDCDWIAQASQLFATTLKYQLSDLYQQLDIELVCSLVNGLSKKELSVGDVERRILSNYVQGGSNYDNVVAILAQYVWRYAMSAEFALLIRKVIQQHSWQLSANEFSLAGRKQTEAEVRRLVSLLLSRLDSEFTV